MSVEEKIGMVIVNYNDYETTKILLDNVKEYDAIKLIVVVDNNSTDDSVEKLNAVNQKKLKIIKSSTNAGYAAALNKGAKHIIGVLGVCKIICSNSDVVIKSNSDIERLAEINSDDIVVTAPVILENGNKNRGWKIPSPNREIIFNLPIIQKYVLKKMQYKDTAYMAEITKVGTVSGCFFMIDSTFLETVNYFDENTFLYYEENIMGIKAERRNKEICIVNDVEIIHAHSVTIDKSVKRVNRVKLQKKSQLYFEKEYNEANSLQITLLKATAEVAIFFVWLKSKVKG